MTISEKAPKKFRYSLQSKMYTCLFDALELLYEANLEEVGSSVRKKKQESFRIKLRLAGTIGDFGQKHGCFTFHQFEVMSKQIYDCDKLLNA